jgi:UDP-N-acetylmuramoyl-L-alanyl-D-glutamate--2,6-diaminopimelate ligase
VPLETVAESIEAVACVPGRLERIDEGQPFDLFVDYAHTPDALERCLQSLKSLTPGRLICVFGAGGDRDKTKRPLMGRAAAHADLAIVTSDNPRSEDPESIVHDVLADFPAAAPRPQVVVDRRGAIAQAIAEACRGDCVLVAGKGHEAVQEFADTTIEFDDRQVARELLRDLQALSHRRSA